MLTSTLKGFLFRLIRRLPRGESILTLAQSRKFVYSPFVQRFPPGHFYSPLPPAHFEELRIPEKSRLNPEMSGIDLRDTAQIEMLAQLAGFAAEIPFRDVASDAMRYHFDNDYFRHSDASLLFAMIRRFKPRQVVEVGSGFSSALMLDLRDHCADANIHLTFVEPFPGRLKGLLKPVDSSTSSILEIPVQSADIGTFENLEANDILFIDSSNVSRFE